MITQVSHREGWGRGGRGFRPHFGAPKGSPKSKKSAKVPPDTSLFPLPANLKKIDRLQDPPNLDFGAPAAARAPISLSRLCPKKRRNGLRNAPFRRPMGCKVALLGPSGDSDFRTFSSDALRARAEGMGEWRLRLTAPGPLPLLI